VSAAVDFASLADRVAACGLSLRGGFHPAPEDGAPPLPGGQAPGTVILVGNVGSGMWATFAAAPEAGDGRPHPLNRWTERVVGQVAVETGAMALFPFGGPPYLPFQRWAMRAEAVAPSPLGILIHPDYGLWHAYRAALAFAARIDLPPRRARPRPCDSCIGRPCLAACPVRAFSAGGYDVAACVGHVDSAAGTECREGGCLARRACPVGAGFAYRREQHRFHMAAFLAGNRAR
jgi:hypothetical protein